MKPLQAGTISAIGSPVGEGRPRAATRRFIEGRGRYLDDISFPRMAHLAFVRSPFAKAHFSTIDIKEALRVPGVFAVVTGADLESCCAGWHGGATSYPGFDPPLQRALASSCVGYAGEAVAAVVAETRAIAEDGAELVGVDWRAQPASAPRRVWRGNFGNGDFAAAVSPDVRIVEETFSFARQTGAPLEPRGIIASYDSAERLLTLHHSHQVPHEMQGLFASALNLPGHRIRLICPDVGGGFGIKLHFYADEVATAAIAMLLGMPIKYVADRAESFVTDVHAREHFIRGRIAVKEDGTLLALAIDDQFSMGAYSTAPRTSLSEAVVALRLIGAPYRIANVQGSIDAYLHDRTPTGQYRGVGMPVACMITERLVDRAADAIRLDAVEIRRRNLLAPHDLPRVSGMGLPLFELSQPACLDKILALMDWPELCAERDRLRELGRYRGIGLAAFIEPTGAGAETNGPGGASVIAVDGVTVKLEPSGGIRCLTGATEQGQGTTAAIGQIVAAALGVDADDVIVVSGDTAVIPVGSGAWASRGIIGAGEAAWRAARLLRQEIHKLAAALLQTDIAALDIAGGRILEIDTGSARFGLQELAEMVYFRGYLVPGEIDPQFAVSHQYRRAGSPFVPTNGFQASYVELDCDTGKITLLKHWVVEDCGRVINPLLLDEQIRGGVAQGIGPALFEACVYDADQRLLNDDLAQYLTPTSLDIPDIVVGHVETPFTGNEIGAKGAGEAGTCGAGAAVLNAVNDALRPFGATIASLPMFPARILAALADARTRPA
jgi:carbon-monoxide dehydrogenase large subunit